MAGFQTLSSATQIIAGIEAVRMIKQGQLGCVGGLACSTPDCC